MISVGSHRGIMRVSWWLNKSRSSLHRRPIEGARVVKFIEFCHWPIGFGSGHDSLVVTKWRTTNSSRTVHSSCLLGPSQVDGNEDACLASRLAV